MAQALLHVFVKTLRGVSMDSPGLQIQFDPVASPEMPGMRSTTPGRKHQDRGENNDASAAAGTLTVSFAEVLRSKRMDTPAGVEESVKKEASAKAKKLGQKTDEAILLPVRAHTVSGGKQVGQSVAGVQAGVTDPTRATTADPHMSNTGETTVGKKTGTVALRTVESAKEEAFTSAGGIRLDGNVFPMKERSVASAKPIRQSTADVEKDLTRENTMAPAGQILKSMQEKAFIGVTGAAATRPQELLKRESATTGAPEKQAFRMKGKAAAAAGQAAQSATEGQTKKIGENASVPRDQVLKTLQERSFIKEAGVEMAQPVDLPKKGALTAAEESVLKDVVRENGALPGRKDTTAQMKSYVHGEPLNRREGIGAVKSMTAREGEVLDILSNGENAQASMKLKAAKLAKSQQASGLREAPENEGNADPVVPSPNTIKQELAGLTGNLQDRTAAAGLEKKQGIAGGTSPESRDQTGGVGMMTAPVQGRGMDNPVPAKVQAVVSQVLDGAAQALRSGSERVVMTLQPPLLGTLDLDVVVQDNRVSMVMLADNQEVKQMLQSGMDDLRNALQEKGFQVDRLEVLVQNRSDEAGSGFWQEAGFARGQSPEQEKRKPESEAVQAAPGSPMRTARTGDSRISIFA
jgi:flagellar hook-length control protein FliK